MKHADRFVILDSVPFTKNNVQNRNRIFSPSKGIDWLTVPVEMKNHSTKPFHEMRISPEHPDWAKSYWSKLTQSYCKHPHFDKYKDELETIIFYNYEYLIDLNMALINFFIKHLKISTPIIRSSSLPPIDARKGDLILELCKYYDADVYLSGSGGRTYLDIEKMSSKGVQVQFQSFKYPDFPAITRAPNLSTIDILMNCGDDALRYFLL